MRERDCEKRETRLWKANKIVAHVIRYLLLVRAARDCRCPNSPSTPAASSLRLSACEAANLPELSLSAVRLDHHTHYKFGATSAADEVGDTDAELSAGDMHGGSREMDARGEETCTCELSAVRGQCALTCVALGRR